MVHLKPLTEDEYYYFFPQLIKGYAKEMVHCGEWQEDYALSISRNELDLLLPKGIYTPGQLLYSIKSNALNSGSLNNLVGYIWVGKNSSDMRTAHIYDFYIRQALRNRGYGSFALKLIEKEMQKRNYTTLTLHAFNHNIKAINLYKKFGHAIVSSNEKHTYMKKEIRPYSYV